MPTKRGYRGRGKSRAKTNSKIADAMKSGAKTVLGGYLKGTQKLADKISSVLPEEMTSYDRSGRGRGGYRGRRGGR